MGGVLLLAIAAQAGIQPSREPLPAREVERGLVLPLGWTELGVDVLEDRSALSGRNGVARGVAVSASVAYEPEGTMETRIGAELSLVAQEPPVVGWSIELGWRQPWALGPGEGQGVFAVRRAFGPFRADFRGGAALSSEGVARPVGSGALLFQAGPLWGEGRVALAEQAEAVGGGTLAAQLTRGVLLAAVWEREPGRRAFGGQVRAWL